MNNKQESREDKVRRGAEDFANRFTDVMKELAEEENHEGVEGIIAEVDDFWDKLYLPKTGKGPHKGKKERLKDWLRAKLTSLNTKKHE